MSFRAQFVAMICQLICLFSFPFQMDAQIFNHTLTLAEFGAVENKIPTLQSDATLSINPFLDLRTNDFQPLEMKLGTYSMNRQMLRMGAFLNSQSPLFFANNPPGPGLTFPDTVAASDALNPPPAPPSPATNITIDTNKHRIVFSALEFGISDAPNPVTLVANPTLSETAQSNILTYTTNTPGSLVDYNVIGNVFHDMEYTNFTPTLSSPLAVSFLSKVTVFSPNLPGGQQTFSGTNESVLLPLGNKLRLTFTNSSTKQEQTWLLYLQKSDGTDHDSPPFFKAGFGSTFRIFLTAQSVFSGFIRAAIVQTTPVPYDPPTGPIRENSTWSTAIQIQTIAPSPAALFMLWPVEFLGKATTKIESNFQTKTFLPQCSVLSILLPVLGKNDIYTAQRYLNQLINKDMQPPSSFDDGTNPFLTYLYMNFAHLYANDITCYQLNQRPFPNYGIVATPESVEATYDQFRDIIPTNAELDVLNVSNQHYKWTYTTLGSPIKNPLIIFPGYKTIDTTQNPPIKDFLILDPVKGPLYVAEANQKQIVFQEAPLPDFLITQFFPNDFWRRLSIADVLLAKKYMDLYFNDPANVDEITNLGNSITRPDAYDNGKILYKAASSIRYGTALMTYLGISKTNIIATTQRFVNAIKTVLEQWLFGIQASARVKPNFPAQSPNFFVGDSTVGGICFPVESMQSNGVPPDLFFGNAIYNDHHFQYGYWLGAAAAVIHWDNEYGSSPWITQTFTSGSGAGPFKMKAFIDVLWRDTVNPDTHDSSFPYHRHGNPWEGHSTANGLPAIFFAAGRNQESLAEDFNCWLGTLFYAKAILETNVTFPGAFTAADTQGFDQLIKFCSTFLSMTATSGNLYYNTSHWPYANTGFDFNVAVGQQYDGLVDSATFFQPGDSPCNVCN